MPFQATNINYLAFLTFGVELGDAWIRETKLEVLRPKGAFSLALHVEDPHNYG